MDFEMECHKNTNWTGFCTTLYQYLICNAEMQQVDTGIFTPLWSTYFRKLPRGIFSPLLLRKLLSCDVSSCMWITPMLEVTSRVFTCIFWGVLLWNPSCIQVVGHNQVRLRLVGMCTPPLYYNELGLGARVSGEYEWSEILGANRVPGEGWFLSGINRPWSSIV